MGRTVSSASGYAPEDDEFDPRIDDFVSKERNYTHFDLPLSEARRDGISFTANDICAHSFWPLLAYDSIERRAKKDENGDTIFVEKARPIKFAAHLDAALLEWYTKALSENYEAWLRDQAFSSSILAYRSGVGDNISHAKSLFDEIRERGECTAIAVDISGFFDNIRHVVLLEAAKTVLKCSRLPEHHFKVFDRMTRFSWVESDALKARLGDQYGRRGRICNAQQFREKIRPNGASLVQENSDAFGIPQGTPLSGLYANMSMLRVDREMHELASGMGGSYRRYSDDIAFIVPGIVDPDQIVNNLEAILNSVGLELSTHKTETSHFSLVEKCQVSNRPFQYLGFTFDGQRVLIRQSSLSRYYSKMHNGVRAKVRAAITRGVAREEIFLRELFRRYTHFGKSRNFPRYAYRASRVLEAPEIRFQMRNHMQAFKAALRYYLDRAYG
ncbi:antiviral reverse transcriptase Drt2 [Erythrobacter sp. JK5]|uniref:antiviral reverse transcriptase Drt2 n=1 Tax=Erythrobacter sp. JK5 TaxID=2829500 RepID=UPI001BA9ACBD|nr:antiviral reverse transcriptase Drt2 [Erythrobacter sp. JK5]QUL38429.1 group II intron reverse transcriptase domain-containing protein [Erythrobacter sp. JK5]